MVSSSLWFSCACAVTSHYNAVSVDAENFLCLSFQQKNRKQRNQRQLRALANTLVDGTKSDRGQCLCRQRAFEV